MPAHDSFEKDQPREPESFKRTITNAKERKYASKGDNMGRVYKTGSKLFTRKLSGKMGSL